MFAQGDETSVVKVGSVKVGDALPLLDPQPSPGAGFKALGSEQGCAGREQRAADSKPGGAGLHSPRGSRVLRVQGQIACIITSCALPPPPKAALTWVHVSVLWAPLRTCWCFFFSPRPAATIAASRG